MKIRFDWLTAGQARLVFRRFFDMPAPPALDALRRLTPADFALVRRRAALLEAADSAAPVRWLVAECDGRIGGAMPVGFAPEWESDCGGRQ